MNIVTGRPMKSWIKILSLFFWVSWARASCQWRPHIPAVYSLSGPVTVTMKETGLLNDPRVKGISVFHPIPKTQFQGRFLPGGIFLSQEMALELKGSVVFYDEGRELSRILKQLRPAPQELKTRGELPMTVINKTLTLLHPYVEGCDQVFASYREKARELEVEIEKKLVAPMKAVFFLGKIRHGRWPETVIVNDGIIRALREKGKLVTYPSDLSYLAWSAKLMNALPHSMLKVGVDDPGGAHGERFEKLSESQFNFSYPGFLIPGYSQLSGFLSLIKALGK
jgi:hypothetical protein